MNGAYALEPELHNLKPKYRKLGGECTIFYEAGGWQCSDKDEPSCGWLWHAGITPPLGAWTRSSGIDGCEGTLRLSKAPRPLRAAGKATHATAPRALGSEWAVADPSVRSHWADTARAAKDTLRELQGRLVALARLEDAAGARA